MKYMIQISKAAILSVACLGMPLMTTNTLMASESALQPSAYEQQMEIIRHHLMPEYLCAAGVTQAQVAGILGAAIDSVDTYWDQLQLAQTTLQSLKVQSGELHGMILNGQASDAEIAQYDALMLDIEAAQASYDSIYAAIDQDILAAMSTAQRDVFLAVRSNRKRGVPVEYQVLTLSDQLWVELKDALAAVRTYDAEDEESESPTGAIQLLSQYDAQYGVNLARVYLSSNLSAVNTAFTQVISGLGS